MRPHLFLPILLATAGCFDDGGGGSDEPPELITYSAICGDDAVQFVVEVAPDTAYSVDVEVGDRTGILESHGLYYDGWDKRSQAGIWVIDLTPVSSGGVDDTSTAYDCNIEKYALRISLFDQDGVLADCAIDDITGVGTFDDEGCF
jgi:hypothetical protein